MVAFVAYPYGMRAHREIGGRVQEVKLGLQFVGGRPVIVAIQKRHIAASAHSKRGREVRQHAEVPVANPRADGFGVSPFEFFHDFGGAIRRA